MTTLSKDELRTLIRETVTETMVSLGIQAQNQTEMQRDFQFMRDLRTATTNMKRKASMVAITALITSLLTAVWLGIKTILSGPTHP